MAINISEGDSFFINKPSHSFKDNSTTEILKKSNAIDFHKTLSNYTPTPLICLPGLSQKYKLGNIYIKDESFRFGLNAFKGLGASYAINEVLKENPEIKTFCTATDGNHGRAVAWTSKLLGKQAIVLVPKHTSQEQVKAIKKEGLMWSNWTKIMMILVPMQRK